MNLNDKKIAEIVEEYDLSNLVIRDIGIIAKNVTDRTGSEFIRMDMGVPGLATPKQALETQANFILENGASQYSSFEGEEVLKESGAHFVNNFTNALVESANVIPTVGAMHGGRIALDISGSYGSNPGVIFIDPGFSVNKQQARELGLETYSIDTFGLSETSILEQIEKASNQTGYSSIMWSSPCNPTWQVFSPHFLSGLAEILEQHNVIGIEDNAYFGFDSRHPQWLDPSNSEKVPSILEFTDNAIALFSGSKIFSYAAERPAFAVLGNELAHQKSDDLKHSYGQSKFIDAFVKSGLYSTIASAPKSAQHGWARLLNQSVDGDFSINNHLGPYVERAQMIKEAFMDNGFHVLYKKDAFGDIGDGFYFTASHPKYNSGTELLGSLLKSGLTAVPLSLFGGNRQEGLRICTSLVPTQKQEELNNRLEFFAENYG